MLLLRQGSPAKHASPFRNGVLNFCCQTTIACNLRFCEGYKNRTVTLTILSVWWSIGDSNPWPRQCECRALTKHAYIRPDAMIELTGFWDLIPFGDASRKTLRRDKKADNDVVMPVNGNLFNHPRQNHLLGVVAGGIKFLGPVVDLLNL